MATDQMAIVDEVCTVFNDDHDNEFLELKKLNEITKEIHDLKTKREEQIKEKIRILTEECLEKEQAMLSTQKPDGALDSLHQQLQQQQAVRNMAKEQLQEAKIKEKEEESNQKQLEKLKASNDEKSTKALPGLKHDLDLYNYMSCIRWQYDAPDNQVKGYVAPTGGGIRIFTNAIVVAESTSSDEGDDSNMVNNTQYRKRKESTHV